MTARTTYESSVKAATATEIATLTANEATKQTTIDASNSVVGYNTINGNYANFNAAMVAAIKAKQAADLAAEQTKQASIAAARETLRGTGDLAPL